MPHGEPDDPSLHAERAAAPRPDQAALAAYLAAGHIFIATFGPTHDVFDGKTIIGPPHCFTDGIYVWPGDAEYYVRTYNVGLPPVFIEHARARGFAVPESVDLDDLEL